MKKIIVLITILLLTSLSQVYSQIPKGRFLVGVSSAAGLTNSAGIGSELFRIGVSTVEVDGEESADTKMTNINIMPKVGYFVVDNLVVGIDGCLFSAVYKSEESKYSYTGTAIGPFARYYLSKGNIIPVVEAGGIFGTLKSRSKSDYYDEESTDNFNSLWGAAGISVRIGNKASLDLLAGYNRFTVKYDSDDYGSDNESTGTLGLKAGFTILFGSDRNP